MKRGVENGALFVGAVIGAGFATGREIVLFFGDSSPLIAAAAGLMLGFFCYVFCITGSKITDNQNLQKKLFCRFGSAMRIITLFCIIIVFIAMFAAAETLVYTIFNIKFAGVISAVICLTVTLWGTDKLKKLNFICVVAVIVLLITIFAKSNRFFISGSAGILRPFAYAALNMLPSGFVMARASRGTNSKDCIIAGATSGGVLTVLLYMLQCTVFNSSAVMPMYSAALASGTGKLAGIIIYLAIFTTLLSVTDLLLADIPDTLKFTKKIPKTYLGIFIILLFWPISLVLGFEKAVDYGYPFVSACGAIVTIVAIIKLKFISY